MSTLTKKKSKQKILDRLESLNNSHPGNTNAGLGEIQPNSGVETRIGEHKSELTGRTKVQADVKSNHPKRTANPGKSRNSGKIRGDGSKTPGSAQYAEVKNKEHPEKPGEHENVEEEPEIPATVPYVATDPDNPNNQKIEYLPGEWQAKHYKRRTFVPTESMKKKIQKKTHQEEERVKKELLFFGIPHTVGGQDYDKNEVKKFFNSIEEISTTHLPDVGYNVKPEDVKGGTRIHTWTGPEAEKPLKILFHDKIRIAVRRAGFYNRRIHSAHGKYKITGDKTRDKLNFENAPKFYVRDSTTKRQRDEFKERKKERNSKDGIRKREVF